MSAESVIPIAGDGEMSPRAGAKWGPQGVPGCAAVALAVSLVGHLALYAIALRAIAQGPGPVDSAREPISIEVQRLGGPPPEAPSASIPPPHAFTVGARRQRHVNKNAEGPLMSANESGPGAEPPERNRGESTQIDSSAAAIATSSQPVGPLPVAASSGTTGTSAAVQWARYSAGLRGAIERHKHYPLIARRRKWEGTVVLRFDLTREGRLLRLEVSHSSHHSVLDDAAVNAVQSVGLFPSAPSELAGEVLSVEVPVVFRVADPAEVPH